MQLECAAAEPANILRALADGNYAGQKGELSLPSSGVLPQNLLDEFEAAHRKSQDRWRLMKRGKETLDRIGIKVPNSLKAQIRRIF